MPLKLVARIAGQLAQLQTASQAAIKGYSTGYGGPTGLHVAV